MSSKVNISCPNPNHSTAIIYDAACSRYIIIHTGVIYKKTAILDEEKIAGIGSENVYKLYDKLLEFFHNDDKEFTYTDDDLVDSTGLTIEEVIGYLTNRGIEL